jgi:hypothetical protein
MITVILNDITTEVDRQHAKWGLQHHPDGTREDNKGMADWARKDTDQAAADGVLSWLDILCEEFFEASAEVSWPKLRAELIQVAAVCVSWIEDGDERL